MATRSVSRAGKAQSRSTKKRSKARKPKAILMDGHLLTPELYRLYEHRLESRQRTNGDMPQERIKKLALSDTIYEFRFSGSAKEKLSPIYAQLSAAALAVMALGQHYPFYDSHARHVRLTGCDALNRLATEAQHLAAKIAAIAEAIRYEDREHLQDWQKRQEAPRGVHSLRPRADGAIMKSLKEPTAQVFGAMVLVHTSAAAMRAVEMGKKVDAVSLRLTLERAASELESAHSTLVDVPDAPPTAEDPPPDAARHEAEKVWQLRAQVIEHVKAIEALCEQMEELPVYGICADEVVKRLDDIESLLTPAALGPDDEVPKPGDEDYPAWCRWLAIKDAQP